MLEIFAEGYGLVPSLGRRQDEFIEPAFFGFISQVSGDDDRYQSPEGDVSVRTDFDETLDEPSNWMNDLEKSIFGVTRVETKQKPIFTQSQYLTCDEFSAPYAHLLSKMSTDEGGMSTSKIKAAIKTAVETRKQHGFDVSTKIEDKSWWAKISKLPAQQLDHFEAKFHIDGGFLYYDDAARGYRLCVPGGRSPVRTVNNDSDGLQSKPDRKPELKRSDCLEGDDQTETHSGITSSKITLREQLIDQLHSDPMVGHRGTNATQSLVADRFYWKQLNSDVSKWVYGCSTCRKAKFDRTKRQGCLQPVQVPNAPGRCYNMDMIVDLPETDWQGEKVSKVLAMVNRFTKRTLGSENN